MGQLGLHNFSKCHCASPGFCPVFSRTMGLDPPDWKWCQKTDQEERKKYYELLMRGPPPEKKSLVDTIIRYNGNIRNFIVEYLTKQTKHHNCEFSNKFQDFENQKIFALLDKKTSIDIDNVEILCLGHKSQQFDSIEDRNYLTKVDLNSIDAGDYSGNHWAEARAFISNNPLFKKNTDYVGFTTASWNLKYEPYCRIDSFHNWHSSRLLFEDNVVLCADIFCTCEWFEKESNILSAFFRKNQKMLGEKLLSYIGLEWGLHKNVPYSNQMIAHKDVYLKYRNFLISNNVFYKVQDFVDNFAYKYKYNDNSEIREKYQYARIYAYLMEMVICFWYSNENFLYVPNAERKGNWYSADNIRSRIKINKE